MDQQPLKSVKKTFRSPVEYDPVGRVRQLREAVVRRLQILNLHHSHPVSLPSTISVEPHTDSPPRKTAESSTEPSPIACGTSSLAASLATIDAWRAQSHSVHQAESGNVEKKHPSLESIVSQVETTRTILDRYRHSVSASDSGATMSDSSASAVYVPVRQDEQPSSICVLMTEGHSAHLHQMKRLVPALVSLPTEKADKSATPVLATNLIEGNLILGTPEAIEAVVQAISPPHSTGSNPPTDSTKATSRPVVSSRRGVLVLEWLVRTMMFLGVLGCLWGCVVLGQTISEGFIDHHGWGFYAVLAGIAMVIIGLLGLSQQARATV